MTRPLTVAARNERYNWIIANLGEHHPHELTQLISQKYNISVPYARIWMKRARTVCRELYHENEKELLYEAAARLEKIMYSPDANDTAKISANKLYISLLGLAPPLKFEHKLQTDPQTDIAAMNDPKIRKMQMDLVNAIASYHE